MRMLKQDRFEYVVRAADRDVGRMREGVLRLDGLADADAARAAGAAVCRALGAWYRERAAGGHGASVTPWPGGGVAADGALAVDGVVVGRVAREGGFAVEVALPRGTLHALAADLVARLHAAAQSGVVPATAGRPA